MGVTFESLLMLITVININPISIAQTLQSTNGTIFVEAGHQLDLICDSKEPKPREIQFVSNNNIIDNTVSPIVYNYPNYDCFSVTNFTFSCDIQNGIYILHIQSYEYQDENAWVCETREPLERSPEVTVLYIDPFKYIEVFPESNFTTLKENDSTTFRCETSFGRPQAEIVWNIEYSNGATYNITGLSITTNTTKNGTRSRTHSFLQYTAKAVDNLGNIYCHGDIKNASSSDTQKTSRRIWLNIEYPPLLGPYVNTKGYVFAENGSQIDIICFSDGGNPLATLNWICDGTDITSNDISNKSTSILAVSFLASPSLNKKKCSCVANHKWASEKNVSIPLNITYNPFSNVSMISEPKSYVNESTDLRLLCTVYGGNPLANVLLTCNGRDDIVNIQNDGFAVTASITFTASRADNGRSCKCVARQNHWIQEKKVSINVYYPPPNTVILDGITNSSVLYETDIATLKCIVPGGNPLAEIAFICGSNQNGQNSGNISSAVSTVKINISRTLNPKQCICKATHILFDHDVTGIVFLNIYYPPNKPHLIVTPPHPFLEGQYVEITCDARGGNPDVSKYEWFKNSIIQSTSIKQNKYIYGNVTENDNNVNIYCRVYNNFTVEKDIVIVTETIRFNIEYSPRIFDVTGKYTFSEGDQITVDCKAKGNPVPFVYWQYNDRNVSSTNKNVTALKLNDIDRQDQGVYICRASAWSPTHKLFLSSSFPVQMVVNYSPDVSIIVLGNNSNEGSSISLLCNASGQPSEYRYSEWKHSYRSIDVRDNMQSNGSHLSLNKLSYKDMGTYTCSVENGIKNRNQTLIQKGSLDLKVKGSPIRHPFYSTVPVFSTEESHSLNASISFFSFPNITSLRWFNLTSNNVVISTQRINIDLIAVELPYTLYSVQVNLTDFCYESSFVIKNFQPYHSGDYALEVSNGERTVNFTFRAVVSGPPDHPSNITIELFGTSISIHLLPGFNGGHDQTLHINYTVCSHENMKEKHFHDSGKGWQTLYIDNLQATTSYCLSVFSSNSKGFSSYNESHCCEEFVILTETEANSEQQGSVSVIVGGSLGIALAICVIVGVIVVVRLRRNRQGIDRQHLKCKSGEDNDDCEGIDRQHLKCKSGEDNDDCEEELKDNPLYGSPVNRTLGLGGDGFRFDDKSHKDKTSPQTNKGKKSKKLPKQECTGEIPLDTVYENSNKFLDLNTETVYANENSSGKATGLQANTNNKNIYGLVYADLYFTPEESGKRHFIRGIENKTNYAFIDLTKTADPLPSDDENDSEETAGKDK